MELPPIVGSEWVIPARPWPIERFADHARVVAAGGTTTGAVVLHTLLYLPSWSGWSAEPARPAATGGVAPRSEQ